MAELRNLEKFEENAIAMCKDQGQREKLTLKTRKRKSPLDAYDLKKLKDKIEKINRKLSKWLCDKLKLNAEVKGDFYDILTYYVNLFSTKKIKEIDVFDFTIAYSGHSIITSADMGLSEYFDEFPDKKRGLDRVEAIYFRVKKKAEPELNFSCAISFDHISYEGSITQETMAEFIESLDKSTFRFFWICEPFINKSYVCYEKSVKSF